MWSEVVEPGTQILAQLLIHWKGGVAVIPVGFVASNLKVGENIM